jgi:hypothetical protein
VYFEDEELGQGVGTSKKDAETLAAANALRKMAGNSSFGYQPSMVASLLDEMAPVEQTNDATKRLAESLLPGTAAFVKADGAPLPDLDAYLSSAAYQGHFFHEEVAEEKD